MMVELNVWLVYGTSLRNRLKSGIFKSYEFLKFCFFIKVSQHNVWLVERAPDLYRVEFQNTVAPP